MNYLYDGDEFDKEALARGSRTLTRAQSISSATFPAYTPSRRGIKYGDWNTKRFGGANTSQSVALPLPRNAVKRDILLNLIYANTTDSVARDFTQHYLSCAGSWADFTLPAEQLLSGPMAGWQISGGSRYLSKGRWAYARAPQITSVHPGTSTVSVQLVSIAETADNMAPDAPRAPYTSDPGACVGGDISGGGGGGGDNGGGGGGDNGGGGGDNGGGGGGDPSVRPPDPSFDLEDPNTPPEFANVRVTIEYPCDLDNPPQMWMNYSDRVITSGGPYCPDPDINSPQTGGDFEESFEKVPVPLSGQAYKIVITGNTKTVRKGCGYPEPNNIGIYSWSAYNCEGTLLANGNSGNTSAILNDYNSIHTGWRAGVFIYEGMHPDTDTSNLTITTEWFTS